MCFAGCEAQKDVPMKEVREGFTNASQIEIVRWRR